MTSKVFAVIPACNEENNIGKIIREVKKYVSNIVVVDDGSRDKTKYVAEKAGAVVLRHIVNLGKGAALKTGCDFAVKKGAKFIITLDADKVFCWDIRGLDYRIRKEGVEIMEFTVHK